ncbi:MAG: hypothetical protein ACRD34_09155 [Bryobacteraceae bacterium]
MFTFVIWAVGLTILFFMARFNFAVLGAAFEEHWSLGIITVAASLVGWCILALIFL